MMDLDVYVNAVMEKMEKYNFYTELSKAELRQSIYDYLKEEYDILVAELTLRADMDQARGVIHDPEWYTKEITNIKTRMIELATELARTRAN